MDPNLQKNWSEAGALPMGPYVKQENDTFAWELLSQEVEFLKISEPKFELTKSFYLRLLKERRNYLQKLAEKYRNGRDCYLVSGIKAGNDLKETDLHIHSFVAERIQSLQRELLERENKDLESITRALKICEDDIHRLNIIEKFYTFLDANAFAAYVCNELKKDVNPKETITIEFVKKGSSKLFESLNNFGSFSIKAEPADSDEKSKGTTPKFEIVYGGEDNNLEQLSQPWGVCADGTGRILVADRRNHKIKIFDEAGNFLLEFGKEGSNAGEFNRPAGIACDNFCRIIVVDKDNHRVQVFTYSGGFLFSFGGHGQEVGKFCFPWAVSVNNNCDIAVSDSKNNRVQIFNKHGVFLKQIIFGFPRSGPAKERESPRGVAFCPDGKLLITEFNYHKIHMFDRNFKRIEVFGNLGSKPGEFNRPQGIATYKDGSFAVADSKNYRVQVFDKYGNVRKVFGSMGKLPGEFDCPQGISFHPNGSILVADLHNGRIQVF